MDATGWRLILHFREPAPGARNMAVDHALLHSVQQGSPPVLRLYAWQPACLSFGRNQHAAGTYDEARIRAAGIDIVRRPTGGLAVLHDRELTYTVAAPAEPLGGPRAAYCLINEALVDALRRLGVPAAVAVARHAPNPILDTAAPCFQAPAPGEVEVAGRKLVGSAQRCERRVLLQHGSILLDGSQADVATFLYPRHRAGPAADTAAGLPQRRPDRGADTHLATAPATTAWTPAGPAPVAAPAAASAGDPTLSAPVGAGASGITLREVLGRTPAPADVAAAVVAGFACVFGTSLALGSLTAAEEAGSARLEPVYAGADWTWRR
jgi:lipoyl(octanoyl) transferase